MPKRPWCSRFNRKARTLVRAFLVNWLSLAVAVILAGCRDIPRGETAVDALTLSGTTGRQEHELLVGIATQASPKLFGVLGPGLAFEYKLYTEATLARDLERIERMLRRRGYYEANVRAARIIRISENHVRVEIEVELGPQVSLRKVDTRGLSSLPFDASVAALKANPLRTGKAFDEDVFEAAKLSISNALADVGYAYARTRAKATVDLSQHVADVTFDVDPGVRAKLGQVHVEGISTLPVDRIRRILGFSEGDPYSRRKLEVGRAAASELGVFSKVEVIPDLSHPETTAVPILVKVEEAPLHSVTAGGGVSLDVLRLAATARIGWTHLNFLGGLRKLSISTAPTLTFFPLRVDNLGQGGLERVLPENSLRIGIEQPAFLEGQTRGFVNAAYNVYPLLYPLAQDADPSLERIIGYNELAFSVGARRPFVNRRLQVGLSMNTRSDYPFTYQGSLADICGSDNPEDTCGLENVSVVYPELTTDLDLRDDPISPTKGVFLSNTLQLAIPVLGGQLQDVRIRPEARAYWPIDYGRKLVLAGRATFGFVFPQNYGDALLNSSTDTTSSEVVRDQHRLLFRAFYSGGPQSNRGYAYQRIGPQGPIGFLVPTGQDCTGAPNTLPSDCILPLGGFSLWEASLELRWRFAKNWGLVAFADASDVDPGIASFSLKTPHISVGPGIRYISPIGPIRVDLGWRVPGLQKLSSEPEDPPDISETPPYSTETWDKAFALHVLIGEAF
jgi:outer membrane protein assembly factor BamA